MQRTLFQTLADPSRLQIVEALLDGERAVNDLVAHMEIHQSGVSPTSISPISSPALIRTTSRTSLSCTWSRMACA